MVFASRTAVSWWMLSVAALSPDGDQLALEVDLAAVITQKPRQLVLRDRDMAVHQLGQAASTEVDSVEASKAAVEEDSEEVSMAHVVVAIFKDVAADSVVAMEVEAVAALAINRMVSAELQMVHQQVLVVAVVAGLAEEDTEIVHHLKNANVVQVVATGNQLDHGVDIATARGSAALLEAEIVVDAMTPESAHTREKDTTEVATSEGTNVGATHILQDDFHGRREAIARFISSFPVLALQLASRTCMDWHCGCVSWTILFHIATLAPWTSMNWRGEYALGHLLSY
jgi:hypothetical protein